MPCKVASHRVPLAVFEQVRIWRPWQAAAEGERAHEPRNFLAWLILNRSTCDLI